MALILLLFVIVACVEAAVVSRLDWPRYQLVPWDGGAELQDLWLKTSDLIQSDAYDPDVHNVYHLFTRSNPQQSQPLPLGDVTTLSLSNYDARKRTVFLLHGWRSGPSSSFFTATIPAYLEAEDVNIIMIDWSVGGGANYLPAILNCIRSGESVARYIRWLVEFSGGDLSRFHLVGRSLGAHQVGIIGRNLGGVVPYITALDPALPGWITNAHTFKPDDGLYTEVIHTNAGMSGFLTPLGDVDFYPNGGVEMPGCAGDIRCNHRRSTYYFAESISGGFLANQCGSLFSALLGNCSGPTLNMGGITPKPGYTGIYHLETNASPPFSKL